MTKNTKTTHFPKIKSLLKPEVVDQTFLAVECTERAAARIEVAV